MGNNSLQLKNFPNIYCASLKESKERQENIKKQFLDNGIESFQFLLSERFENTDDLLSKINKLTIDDYIKLKPFIDHNYEIAKNDEVKPKLSYIFNQFIELNKL